MKKILSIASLFALTSMSVSANNEINVNCETVQVDITTSIGERFYPTVYWEEKASFPNPPETKMILDKLYKFSCNNISSSYDGNVLELKMTSYSELLKHLASGIWIEKPRIDFYNYKTYVYPELQLEPIELRHSIRLNDWELEGIIPKTAVIGYKVDGSEMKPLYYNGKASDYKSDLKSANVVDIYYKYNDQYDKPNNFERIYFDKDNALIRLYKKYDFPE